MAQQVYRRHFISAIGAGGAVGLAGCLGDDNDGNGDENGTETSNGDENGTETGNGDENLDRTLRVGVVQPQTGALGAVGQPVTDAATLPVRQIERADTSLSVDLQTEDTQTEPQAAISAAQGLVDAGYPAISGPLSTATTLQIVENVTVPNEVVQCTLGTAPVISAIEDNDFLFRTSTSDEFMSQAIAQVATEKAQAETVSTLSINDAYGQSLAEAFAEAFEGEVLDQVAFDPEETSYTSQLSEALSDDPDALYVVAFTENGIQILRDFYADFDGETQILGSAGLRNPELGDNVDADLTNITGVDTIGAGPSVDYFTDLYEDEYDRETTQFTWQAYDATAVLLLANAAAGENDGASVRDQMREVASPNGESVGAENLVAGLEMAASGTEITYRGVATDVVFDENGDIESGSYVTYSYDESGALQLGERIDIGE